MGTRDYEKRGYPRSLQKKDWLIYKYCGGGGGSDCPPVQNNTQVRFAIEVNPFIVFNRSLVLRNPEFFGIALYVDQGPAGLCSNSYDVNSPQDWWLGFSTDGNLTDSEVFAQDLLQDNLAPPYDIEIPANKLPQPTDGGWDSKIYIHAAWKNPNFVADQLLEDDVQYLRVSKHNYDLRQ